MAYTTLSGGKRLRAIMTLETAKMFKLPIETALPLACSVEIMHAYSLIHDDLPCMDNDDLRRGKPTNHKIYGEAIATLAGDALISFGAQIIIDKTPNNIPKEIVLDIVKDYLVCAGAKGIIAGQVADIKAQDKKGNIEKFSSFYPKKMREKMFGNMQRLPVKYFDTNDHGDIMSYYTNDIDTLRQIVYRIPRRFLFIRWGTKALRQRIVSTNPHTRIVAAEYVRIEK